SSEPKPSSVPAEQNSFDDNSVYGSPVNANGRQEHFTNGDYTVEKESSYARSEDGSARSPRDSPFGRNTAESPSKLFSTAHFERSPEADAETHRSFDESTWVDALAPWLSTWNLIQSLGHGERFGQRVELGEKANSCNLFGESFVIKFFIDSGTESGSLSPKGKRSNELSTMVSKWDIEKFTGSNDFGLWKVKMRAVLVQLNCEEALLGTQMLAHLSAVEKTEMNKKEVGAITLCLGDKFLKEQLFFFRMVESKPVMEQLSEFNKIIDDLANVDVNLEDEDKSFHLLSALPRGRSENEGKWKGKKNESKPRPNGDSGGKFQCYHCQESGHFRRGSPKRRSGGSSSAQIVVSEYEEGYESAGALIVICWEP
ncbi:cytochrome p450, partial [Trifolium pratense]